MARKKEPKPNVDDTLETRRALKKAGKEPVPEPSDELKNKKFSPKET